MFSVKSLRSFDGVVRFAEEIMHSRDCDLQLLGSDGAISEGGCRLAGEVCPMVLVGNKSDLRRGTSEESEVGLEEAQELARRLGCPYIETSAKTSDNVEEAFHECVRQVMHHRVGHPSNRQGADGRNKDKRKRFCTIL